MNNSATIDAAIINHFQDSDDVMHGILTSISIPALPLKQLKTHQYFGKLCDDIISQQLSLKAAATISKRFTDFFDASSVFELQPEILQTKEPIELRALGLSMAKANYVIGLAKAVANDEIDFATFPSLSDEEIITKLVYLKGIGRWTAEMFLIFTMGRENVFSWGDLGLKRGLQLIYGATFTPTEEKSLALVESWAPYKSYASLALWAFQDQNKNTEKNYEFNSLRNTRSLH